jgi:thiol-disulfide isomerase/thioredoxin
MNQKLKTILFMIAFAALLIVAYFVYQSLTSRYKPETQLPIFSSEPAKSEASSNVASAAESSFSAVPNASSATISSSVSSAVTSENKLPAPNFTVYDAAGKAVKLSDFKGKPVVLNFWASWCPPCKGEMPDFNEVYGKEKNSVQFLMVNMTDGQQETTETASNFVKSKGFSFPIYFDTKFQAADAYGISSIPQTFIIDKNGSVVNSYLGGIDKSTLEKEISKLK